MAVITKRHFWGFKQYDTKTGKYQGESSTSHWGEKQDWRGRKVEQSSNNVGLSRKTYDD